MRVPCALRAPPFPHRGELLDVQPDNCGKRRLSLPADPVDYTIQICLGHHWWWQTGTVVQPSSGDSLTFQFNEYGGINATTTSPSAPAENYFFLEGEGELDFPGESWLDSSGSLSLWTPEGDSPANHLVRV